MNTDLLKYAFGIDMSKDKFAACFIELSLKQTMKIKGSRTFDNNPSGFREFKAWATKRIKDPKIIVQFGVEVTGVYHENLLFYLDNEGFPVRLLLGRRTKMYLKSIGHESKTDKLDAQGIAKLIANTNGPNWKPACEEILTIRHLLRYRKALISSSTANKNRLAALSFQRIVNKDVEKSLTKMIKLLKAESLKMEKEAIALAKKDAAFFEDLKRISDSLPGIGLITALIVVTETNGFTSFGSVSQLISYAGYDIVENESGKYKGKTRISKRGNVHIRAALYMPALTASTRAKAPLKDYYERLFNKNGQIFKKASVAVQRKLLVLIYTLWKKKEAYDPNYLNPNHLKLETPEKGVALV
ncbi:IS110 family transposase [Chitinophagales bacterium]|nr:IS110 family transposase [Chitinophagales bacterium]